MILLFYFSLTSRASISLKKREYQLFISQSVKRAERRYFLAGTEPPFLLLLFRSYLIKPDFSSPIKNPSDEKAIRRFVMPVIHKLNLNLFL